MRSMAYPGGAVGVGVGVSAAAGAKLISAYATATTLATISALSALGARARWIMSLRFRRGVMVLRPTLILYPRPSPLMRSVRLGGGPNKCAHVNLPCEI